MSAIPERKLKRGDVCPDTGRLFWAYAKGAINGECWITAEALDAKRKRNIELYWKNPETRRDSVKRSHLKHREKRLAYGKNYRDSMSEEERNAARDYSRAYNSSEAGRARSAKFRNLNKGRYSERERKYRKLNKDRILSTKRKWNEENREEINTRRRQRGREDELFNLKNRVRVRTAFAFQKRGYAKSTFTHKLIGCEWRFLKSYIEARFKEGMSWENRSEWHIDHIIPLASATTKFELMALCHYTNLQPLWAEENMIKGDKMSEQLMA